MPRTQAMCRPSSQQNTTKMKSSKANFVTWTFRLPPKRQLIILLNFFFPFIDIWFFSQVLNFTSVELNRVAKQVKLKKKNLFFQKRRWSCDFRQEKRRLPNSTAQFPPRIDDILQPRRVALGHPSPPPESVRRYVRTLTSQPKFLTSTGYQINVTAFSVSVYKKCALQSWSTSQWCLHDQPRQYILRLVGFEEEREEDEYRWMWKTWNNSGKTVDKMPGNILFGYYWLFELMRLSINFFRINARCIKIE